MTSPHPSEDKGLKPDLMQRYAEVRARLRNLPPGPPDKPRRLVAVRPQPHRPDYVPPPAKLPTVIITEETKRRVHDILTLAQETNGGPLDTGHWLDIVHEVCAKHEITRGEMMSVRRARNLVAARHEAMWRMSKETSMSLPAIGRRMGGKDHTTVLHGIRRHEAKLQGTIYAMPRYGKAVEAAGL